MDNIEHRGGDFPASFESNQLDELSSGEAKEPKVDKSRRKFLKLAGLAASKFVPESKA